MLRWFKNLYLPTHIPLGNEWVNEPPQCMPDQYKVPGCSITAYWNYYEQEKHTVAAKDEQLIFRPDEKKIIQTFS